VRAGDPVMRLPLSLALCCSAGVFLYQLRPMGYLVPVALPLALTSSFCPYKRIVFHLDDDAHPDSEYVPE
jgi:hypothetical protein